MRLSLRSIICEGLFPQNLFLLFINAIQKQVLYLSPLWIILSLITLKLIIQFLFIIEFLLQFLDPLIPGHVIGFEKLHYFLLHLIFIETFSELMHYIVLNFVILRFLTEDVWVPRFEGLLHCLPSFYLKVNLFFVKFLILYFRLSFKLFLNLINNNPRA